MAGTTRDPVDTTIETEQGNLTFIDTAGLKKQSRQADNTEYYSSLRSFTAIDKADCVLFVVDGTEGVTHYDMRLLERIDAAGCALVLLLNKWDLLNTEERLERLAVAKRELGFVDYAPIMTISALSGRNFDKIIPALFEAKESYEQRIPTSALNKVIHEAQIAHPHPNRRNKRVKISYATQGAVNPPTFTIFATQSLDNSYVRYLENTLRDKFDLGSTSIKLRVRKKQD
jgi:GTP-binding protein